MIDTIPSAYLLRVIDMSRQRFLHGLECVPEDRLAWSPGTGAHAPLQLAARLASFLDHRSRILRSPPGVPVPRPVPPVPASREEAIRRVEEAFAGLMAGIQALSAADLERLVPAPWGADVPAGIMVLTVLNVLGYFQAQLNYCQLAYGDADPNIPAAWREPDG